MTFAVDIRTLPDNLDQFFLLKRQYMEDIGIEVKYKRSFGDVSDQSSTLTLRHANYESKLVVWESGKADLYLKSPAGQSEEHVAGLYEDEKLANEIFEKAFNSLGID